jgi:hypothetical protein
MSNLMGETQTILTRLFTALRGLRPYASSLHYMDDTGMVFVDVL